jgi:biopolymer transport protein ExbD
MASQKLISAAAGPDEDLKMDMSPMIDLVFLLLIFFMVNSTLIVVRIDKDVQPPVADKAKVAKDKRGRIVINVRQDGKIYDENIKELVDEEAITRYVRDRKALNDMNDLPNRIHLRADKRVPVKEVKRAVQAAAAAGVIEVIFASYVTDK